MLAFLPAIRVYAARKFFLDNVDPDRLIDIRYFKKNQNSWLTEFIKKMRHIQAVAQIVYDNRRK